MTILIVAVLILAFLASASAGIWLMVLEFRKSIWWGLGGIFLHGPVTIIFGVMYWSEVRRPFLLWLTAFAVMIIDGGAAAVFIPNTQLP